MIDEVRIENLGVIDTAAISFAPGLTAITGETGAGKTMLLTSLGLLLGAPADSSKVRRGTDRILVEGIFDVPSDSDVAAEAADAGADLDAEEGRTEVPVARQVPAEGRSRCYLGGRSVPRSVLDSIGSRLVTIHGQSEQMRLRSASAQLQALDSAGGAETESALTSYSEAWQGHRRALAELEQFRADERDIASRRLALTALVEAVDEVEPVMGEEEDLKHRIERLDSIEETRSGLARALSALSGDGEMMLGAADLLGQTAQALATLKEPGAAESGARAAAAEVEARDLIANVGAMLSGLETDEDLNELHARRAKLRSLSKKLGMGIDEAIGEADRARAMLAVFDDPELRAAELEAAVATTLADLRSRGKLLHEVRSAAAETLAQEVNGELAQLALGRAEISIDVESVEPRADGMDRVTFMFRPDPHAASVPLSTSASGGELSRIMLAIELVLSRSAPNVPPTFVFDEIDAGVGGEAAKAIGARLAALAEHAQVIVVTHLAQVASWADRQIVVARGERATEVRAVADSERVTELARMLSGSADLDSARRHAADLLSESTVGR
ncbi:DNA repair protein RecN [Flaviflexus salsibiostraticola]|uniref:DNA repair protein RecN n=1 Tax=Flaviflexus salsibiostraticola TaxID=1282737 RepID=A0A3S8Z7Y8_9ACTO|nr:DNA repair protein RecN [Flaviflexus salsibiostraticola]AZN29436.1 DNA repair protein RecN [Flaviflexus salsibiostraticola]